MGEHDGQVALVTGGAMGIGAGIVESFAADGAALSVADVNEAAARGLVDRLNDAGRRAIAVIGDVSSLVDTERMVAETVAEFGGLDVLVNNAGIQPTASYMTAEEMDEATWDRIIDINLKGQFLMSKFAIPHLRERGGGVIINIASVQGLQSQPQVPAYAASKGRQPFAYPQHGVGFRRRQHPCAGNQPRHHRHASGTRRCPGVRRRG